MKLLLSLPLAILGVAIGVFTFYEVFVQLFPVAGWVPELLVSLAFASFAIIAGTLEIVRWLSGSFRSGGDVKRCRACRVLMPRAARYCRECGTAF